MTEPACMAGASDDLIELEGTIREEFNLKDDDEGDLLAFSTGVILRVRYSSTGVWRITPVAGTEGVNIVQAPEDDEDNYADVAYLLEAPAWVVHGVAMAKP